MKLVIMQPYFIPYAGYFRLFCASDLFVIYDCVQFPRRGWVHRNQMVANSNKLDWITLPLQKQPVDTLIRDLKFRDEIDAVWRVQLNRFNGMKVLNKKYPRLFNLISLLNKYPVNYLVEILCEICSILNIPFNIAYSTQLGLSSEIKGQDRIIQIAKHFNAFEYINAPGGRDLYNESDFLSSGIHLKFLPQYKGEYYSIVQYLIDQEPQEIRDMLFSQSLINA